MHHTITIASSERTVRRIIAEAENWPVYFAPTIAVERTVQPDDDEKLTLWARPGTLDAVVSWSSTRRHSPCGDRIDFAQDTPVPPLTGMSGAWLLRPRGAGTTEVTLEHTLTAPAGISPDALRDLRSATDHNSTVELAAVDALAVEYGDTLPEHLVRTSDDVWIDAPPAAVYELLWDVSGWPQLLPHVMSVDLLSQGKDQHRFVMTLAGDESGAHCVESVRVAVPGRWVGFKQLRTPTGVRGHAGTWTLRGEAGGTRVTVRHLALFDRVAEGEAEGLVSKFGTNLSRSSLATLTAIDLRTSAAQHDTVGREGGDR